MHIISEIHSFKCICCYHKTINDYQIFWINLLIRLPLCGRRNLRRSSPSVRPSYISCSGFIFPRPNDIFPPQCALLSGMGCAIILNRISQTHLSFARTIYSILGGTNDEACLICFILIGLFKVRIHCLFTNRDWSKSNVTYFNALLMG